ncbi:MAG: phosphomethylpyrimidine synthase ThiC, partial [Candidatus Aminicenantes bacterium]|nr:phosphomethylpyrimidine synthase ThiC [Candidatus Aminicenantes bacterium]
MTQLEHAKKGHLTPAVKHVAAKEGLSAEEIGRLVAQGRIVIPLNSRHTAVETVGIGKNLRTKV